MTHYPDTGQTQAVTQAGSPGAFRFDVVLCGLLAAAFYVAVRALAVAAIVRVVGGTAA